MYIIYILIYSYITLFIYKNVNHIPIKDQNKMLSVTTPVADNKY